MNESDVVEFDMSNHLTRLQQVTAVTASSELVCIGGQNASILCIALIGGLINLEG